MRRSSRATARPSTSARSPSASAAACRPSAGSPAIIVSAGDARRGGGPCARAAPRRAGRQRDHGARPGRGAARAGRRAPPLPPAGPWRARAPTSRASSARCWRSGPKAARLGAGAGRHRPAELSVEQASLTATPRVMRLSKSAAANAIREPMHGIRISLADEQGEWLAWSVAAVTAAVRAAHAVRAAAVAAGAAAADRRTAIPRRVAEARATMAGFYLGARPVLPSCSPSRCSIWRSGCRWALTAFGRLISMLVGRAATTALQLVCRWSLELVLAGAAARLRARLSWPEHGRCGARHATNTVAKAAPARRVASPGKPVLDGKRLLTGGCGKHRSSGQENSTRSRI